MFQGCNFLVKLARFVLCAENLFICAKQCCWNLKYYLLCGCLSNSESRLVVGFRPRVTSTGVFVENPDTLYPNVWSLKEVSSAANKAIGLCGFIIFT